MRGSNQGDSPEFDDFNDDQLQKAVKASQKEHQKKERERRRREEERAAEEATWEATAIAESSRAMEMRNEVQRREAAAEEAEFERVLRESAAEAEQRKFARLEELDRLHANFGRGGGSAHIDRSRPQSPAPLPSDRRPRADSDSTPRNSGDLINEQRQRALNITRNSAQNPPSQRPRSTTVSPDGAQPRGNGLLNRALGSVRRPPRRSNSESNHPSTRRNVSDLQDEIRAENISGRSPSSPRLPRQMPHLQYEAVSGRERHPLQVPDSPPRRHSERSPRPSSSLRQQLPISRQAPSRRATNHELDAQTRQALNNSHRYARMDERFGGSHSRREDEMIRRAMEESLGDAPPPPDPSEGLLDPPPSYEERHRDKFLDPRRYTTTNERGNEPGYLRRITPEILKVMQKWLEQVQKFDADSKAAGKDQQPAINTVAKKQPQANTRNLEPQVRSSSDNADELQELLGGRRPVHAPPAPAAFVSRMPGLATDARSRIPNARPWDNAFSRLPTSRPATRRRDSERRRGH